MKKYMIISLIVLTTFLFYINPQPVSAIASLSLSPDSKGLTGVELTIKGEQFCVHNAGFPVTVMWDGAPIDVGIAPSFEIKYTVPSDATAGSHIILAIANCPGQPPTIPPSVDQATTTYTVVAESEDAPNQDSTGAFDNETDTESEEDEEITTVVTDDTQQDKDNKKDTDENTTNPWYSNWIYLGLLGLGLILFIVGIVLIARSKKNMPFKSKPKQNIEKPTKDSKTISRSQPKTVSKFLVKKPSKDDTRKTPESRVEYEE